MHAIGQINEQELSQVEHHMNLVHGLALQLVEIANRTERLVLVVDLKGIKLKTLGNKMLTAALKRLAPMCNQFFPEILHRAYIVNAPMYFSQTWATVEKLLSPGTLAKIRVLGAPTDPEIAALVVYPQTLPRFQKRHFPSQWAAVGIQEEGQRRPHRLQKS